MKVNKDLYYDISKDIEIYPDAWCYIVVGGRSTGKTYGALKREYIDKHEEFAFIKRTNEDVKIMCSSKSAVEMDLSPFKPINRDFITNVKPVKIQNGIGGFYECNDENEPSGKPIGYILSLNAISNIKGFDLSDCKVMIFDEFIPNIYDRVHRSEGEQVLELYRTIARDRELRGQKPLKLIALANATRVYNPLFEVLGLVDEVVNMKKAGRTIYYQNGIFLRLLDDNEAFREHESNTAIMKSLKDTRWGKMALENEFAYDDFSCIGYTSLKGYNALYGFSYKNMTYYVYKRGTQYYICRSKAQNVNIFNLDTETECKLFFRDTGFKLRQYTIEGRCLYSDYTAYNYILNFKKIFDI